MGAGLLTFCPHCANLLMLEALKQGAELKDLLLKPNPS